MTPRIGVDVSSDGVRAPLGREAVAQLVTGVLRAEGVKDGMLSVTFLDERAMARLNARHLGHRGSTDVISFGLTPTGTSPAVVGDVYICPAVARVNAAEHGCGVREEAARLVVHGVLHVLGHDHPEGSDRAQSRMWKRQEQLLRRLWSATR